MTVEEVVVIDGVTCTPERNDPTRWRYLPHHPSAQLGPDARPMVSLIETGDIGFLQVSCQLDPAPERLEAVRVILQRQAGVPFVRLQSAVRRVTTVRLVVPVPGNEEPTELTSGSASGFAPHTSALQASIANLQLDAAKASTAGTRGQLQVWFDFVTSDGDCRAIADIADWLYPSAAQSQDRQISLETTKDSSC